MYPGAFITVEGTEGAGKSTAMGVIQTYLQQANLEVVVTREPGGTKVAETIRELLLNEKDEIIYPETELLLMFAARQQHIKQIILPALVSGTWVLSDRYIDASYAYQGDGRKLDKNFIQSLDHWVVGNLYPDFTLLLDLAPAIGFERATQPKDRIEQEQLDFFIRVREGYLKRAQANPDRMCIIDASQTLAEVHAEIKQALDKFVVRKKRVH